MLIGQPGITIAPKVKVTAEIFLPELDSQHAAAIAISCMK
jgi:hypothetical protein